MLEVPEALLCVLEAVRRMLEAVEVVLRML